MPSLIFTCNPKHVKRKKQASATSKHGYTERNRNLKSLGFRSYSEYIQSEMWSTIREMVFADKGRKCVCCSGDATQIHHSAYDMKTLVGASIKFLHPVCRDCHENAEFEHGEKRNKSDANTQLGVKGISDRAERRYRKRKEAEERLESQLKNVSRSIKRKIRGRFGRGSTGDSMRDLAKEFGLPKNVVRAILGMKPR